MRYKSLLGIALLLLMMFSFQRECPDENFSPFLLPLSDLPFTNSLFFQLFKYVLDLHLREIILHFSIDSVSVFQHAKRPKLCPLQIMVVV